MKKKQYVKVIKEFCAKAKNINEEKIHNLSVDEIESDDPEQIEKLNTYIGKIQAYRNILNLIYSLKAPEEIAAEDFIKNIDEFV